VRTLGPRVAVLQPRLKPATVKEHVRRRNLSGGAWETLRQRILKRDGGMCQCDECKRLNRVSIAHEVDHRIPLWEGGTDHPSNLQAINRDCHQAKTAVEAKRRQG
jgi:5-methylcytosine-specific restriction protein A